MRSSVEMSSRYVYCCMKTSALSDGTERSLGLQILKQEYDSAFRSLAVKARRLQEAKEDASCDETAVREAWHEVDQATAEYQSSRNQLMEFLLPPGTRVRKPHIERAAYFLWENAGRPSGTAQEDWHRAQQLVALKAVPA